MAKLERKHTEAIAAVSSTFIVNSLLESLQAALEDLPEGFKATKLAHKHLDKVFSTEWNRVKPKYIKED